MSTLQGHIIAQQREEIEALRAELMRVRKEAWDHEQDALTTTQERDEFAKQYERVWKDRQLAFREITALQAECAANAAIIEASRLALIEEKDQVVALHYSWKQALEELAEVKRDKEVLTECWRGERDRADRLESKNADLQTAYNLQRSIADRHETRANNAIETLEAIGWEFAVANFSSEDVESLIDEELESRDRTSFDDIPY